MPLTSSGKIPLSKSNRIMQEAVFGPAGKYYNLAGTIAATDGSVRADVMGVWAALRYSWMDDQHFGEASMETLAQLQQSYQDC